MYLIVIQVPFQKVSSKVARVAADWGRSLRLLRDSLDGRYGPLVVAAPGLSADFEWVEQQPIELIADQEEIHFVQLCDANLRARQFWPQALRVYRRCLKLARQADVVHAGMSDLFRPIAQLGFYAALRVGTPTVFVDDTDTVSQMQQLVSSKSSWKTTLYCALYEKLMRHAVARADLSLLKGKLLHARYGGYAKNPKDFHDTSYSESWVLSEDKLDAKLAELSTSSVLRCVSLGRLIARKGVDESIRVIGALRKMGVPAALDIIGDGPERGSLETLAAEEGLRSVVHFLGNKSYGRLLVESLRAYHLMLFTPIAEDTPRSLFDALAAGLPIAGYEIDYLRDVLAQDNCGLSAPIGAVEQLSDKIHDLWSQRDDFANFTENAAKAGRRHSAEAWYRLRARWTLDAANARVVSR